MDIEEFQHHLTGLMSFPVTPFDDGGEVDLPRLREHVRLQLSTSARALFIACGTGELFSLNPTEHAAIIEAAVDEVAGAKPVVAGVGYGTSVASEMARASEAAGADGVLVLPPYLFRPDQDGLRAHFEAIAGSVGIGVIPYQRDNVVIAPETVAHLARIPNIVGLKDALGDTDRLVRARLATEGKLPLMNGMPTAEISAQAYAACGVVSYSSAALNFVPEIAEAFYGAFQDGDRAMMDRLLAGFYIPLVALRDRRAGYAVSLIKAGVSQRYGSVGDVRLPLMPPSDEDLRDLDEIMQVGLALVTDL
jgi:5-dehydro-4-deoxyglucarate dehydratase